MPPNQTDDHPPLLQEDHQEHPTKETPREEASSLAAGSSQRSRPRENDHPHATEPQSGVTAQRTKSFSDGNTQTPESITLLMDDYQELRGVVECLGQQLAEKSQALDAESQKHEATKTDLEGAKQNITSQWEDHEATQLQLAELKDAFDVVRKKNKRLKAKAQAIEAEPSESEDQQRDFEAIKSQLEESQRENKSLKLQDRDRQNALAVTQERLNTRDRELHATQNQLEEAEEEVAALRCVNDKNGVYNTKIKAIVEKHKKSLARAQEDYKTREAVLVQEKSALEAENEASRKEFDQNEMEWREQQAKLVKSLREHRGQEHRYVNKVPDETLKEMYWGLQFKIDQFIQKYAGEVPNALAVGQNLEPIWEELTPNATKFLMSGVLHITITEAYIWEWLRRTVFVAESKYWGGEIGALFGHVLSKAQNEIKGPKDDPTRNADYHHWRASSSNFLAGLHEPKYSLECCRPDVEAMVTTLSKNWASLDVEGATRDAMVIFDDARSLDVTLRKLKAKFVWGFEKADMDTKLKRRFRFSFQAGTMKDFFRSASNAAVGPAAVVDLVVSPALFKRGNNDGSDYLSTDCCLERKVVCNAAMFFPQSSPFVGMPAGAPSPQEEVGHSHAVQTVKNEGMSADTYEESHLSPYTSLVFQPELRKHGKVAPRTDTEVEIKVETSPKETAPERNTRASLGAIGYRGDFSPPEARVPGVKNTQKRKRESDDSDDELGDDYVPRTSATAAFGNRISRYEFRRQSAK